MKLVSGTLVMVFATLVLTSCGGSSDPSDTAATETEPGAAEATPEETKTANEPSGPLSIDEGIGLDRGPYETQNFHPGFTFKIPDYEWIGDVDQKDIVAMFINNSDWRNEIAFHNPTKVSDLDGGLIKAPHDLLGYFKSHPGLKQVSAGTTKVGNLSGPYVDVALADYPTRNLPGCDGEKCFPLIQNSVFNWSFLGDDVHADTARIIELDVGNDDVLVTVAAMEKREGTFRAAYDLSQMLKMAEPILKSVEFNDGA
jgi:hypothetical protein